MISDLSCASSPRCEFCGCEGDLDALVLFEDQLHGREAVEFEVACLREAREILTECLHCAQTRMSKLSELIDHEQQRQLELNTELAVLERTTSELETRLREAKEDSNHNS